MLLLNDEAELYDYGLSLFDLLCLGFVDCIQSVMSETIQTLHLLHFVIIQAAI